MIIKCRTCGETKEQAKGQSGLCNACSQSYQREYRAANKDHLTEYAKRKNLRDRQDPAFAEKERKRGREYWQKLRHTVILAYGGYVCACCGETEPAFLTIDHVNNDGAEHRRSLGAMTGNGKEGYGRTLKWLRDNDFPDGFQILCMNCNFGKARNGGTCPHATLHKQTA